MQTKEYPVNKISHGQTLQDFIVAKRNISRKAAKNLMDRRKVFVNGKRVWMAKHNLKTGDIVSILLSPGESTRTRKQKIPIVWEDSNYLIVNKPANVLSVGKGSLENRLQQQCENPQLRAVHRLDRDTTGCLIIAKSENAFQAMLPLFRERSISKTYHAIVHGFMKKGEHRISKPLEGQTAVSHVRVLDSVDNAAHVAVKIETGRTHQIRIHLASFNHPVMGDPKYAGDVEKKAGVLPIPRQMLHARTLVFTHPTTGNVLRTEAPLPADFRACLKSFKLT